jgi:O-antigen ligase
VIWSWWAWQKGGYFETVLLPGAIFLCVGATLLVLFLPGRPDVRHRRSAAMALVALMALGVWSLLSALWSPAPDVAIGDGQRILVYALAFGLGLWLCNLLGPRMRLALLPLAAAGAFAGIATVISLLTADDPRRYLEIDGTLDYPLGYRNANAAFFAIAVFPALGLAADRTLDWRARGLALGTATLVLDLAMLSQSRGSMPAGLAAIAVYALLSPLRVRALSWLALAVLPAIGFLPALDALYSAANDGRLRDSVSELHATGVAAAVTSGIAVAIGLLAARFEPRLPGIGSVSARWNRAVSGGLAAAAALATIGFVVAVGDPVDWIADRADEFHHAGTPDLSSESSRFTLNAGSDRYDLWRVALEDTGEDPLLGVGGGGYQYTYLRGRESVGQTARDAHSVELEVLGELGLPGLLLLLIALAAAAVAALRARRSTRSAAALSAVALAAATYWLVHASIDWFWAYPALTAPTIAMLGAAAAPGLPAVARGPSRLGRGLLLAGLATLALSAIPPFLSQRYVNQAFDDWRTDLDSAYLDLDRARSLNPLSDSPLLAEGAIARAAGDRGRALRGFREATAERPEEWAGHYVIAVLLVEKDPRTARGEAAVALQLNPLDRGVHGIARRLGLEPPPRR